MQRHTTTYKSELLARYNDVVQIKTKEVDYNGCITNGKESARPRMQNDAKWIDYHISVMFMIIVIICPKYLVGIVRNFVKWKLVIMFRVSMLFSSIWTEYMRSINRISSVLLRCHASSDMVLSDTQLSVWKVLEIQRICYRIFMNILMYFHSWWRHQMELFYALLALCVGNSPAGEFPK